MTILARYESECRCGRAVMSTPAISGKAEADAWIRCSECDKVNLAVKTGSETLGGDWS